MPRGFTPSEYLDDDGIAWRLLVDADYAVDPNRGWVTGAVPGLPPVPRLWKPREVVGIDPSGRLQRTRVGALTAPLWTGAAPAFFVNLSDMTAVMATVIRRIGEKRRL